jgi:pimeloyl-ACP methyl ester carboxylesterase
MATDSPSKDGGELVRWAEQRNTSSKKIVFIHGANATGYWKSGEVRFDLKVRNLNWIGEEDLGIPTSNLAEIWFYNYYPNQPIDKIVNDLMLAIEGCEDFNGSQIALVGHSQGGVVAYRLIQQHPDLIDGAVCLGAPIQSTPLAFKEVLYTALKIVFKHIWNKLIPKFDTLSKGTEQLKFEYQAPDKLPDNVYLFAGSIGTMRIKWALTWPWNLDHYINLIDVVASVGGNFFSGPKDDRQFLEITADLIEKSDWGNNGKWDKLSDGLVPVSSALAGATKTDDQHVRIPDTDHTDLLSGKGDLTLDRMIFNCLVSMLDLKSQAAAIEIILPDMPDFSGLTIGGQSPLKRVKFAYVSSIDQKIYLTDGDWQQRIPIIVDGICSYPEFNPKNLGLTFTVDWQGGSNVFLYDARQCTAIRPNGQSRCSSFSPDGKWLVYQSGDELVIYNLKSQKRHSLVRGVNLASPSIWVAEWLKGKIYFANQNSDGKINLYCASPRWRRTRGLDETTLVATNIGRPHLLRGLGGGMIAIQSNIGADGSLVSQQISLVSGLLEVSELLEKYAYSLMIRFDGEKIQIDRDHQKLLMSIDQAMRIESVVFDRAYYHLYMVDTVDVRLPSIYMFNLNMWLGGSPPEDCWQVVVEGGYQLDINTLAE